MTLPARKLIRLTVKVGVPRCHPSGTVEIQALAYQLTGNGEEVVCSKDATPLSIRMTCSPSPSPKWGQHGFAGEGDCTRPTPAPSSFFELLSDNERLLNAVPVPDNGRRSRGLQNEQSPEGETAPTDVTGSHRDLVVMTANQCFQACGDFLNSGLPYFF